MGFKRNRTSGSASVTRMLDAAEALFAEQGMEETSVRQITGRAGVNVSSVNYHFGSKDHLAEAVFERVVARVTAQRLYNLDRLMRIADDAGTGPDLSEVVSTFVETYLGDGNEAQGVLMARFILLHRLSPNPATKRIVDAYLDPLAVAYVTAFQRTCPDVPREVMVRRYLMMVSTIVLTTTEDRDGDRLSVLSEGRSSISDRSAARDALVRFVVAGISGRGEERFTPMPDRPDTLDELSPAV